MSVTCVLFDLDGTLLPMDQDVFIKSYFGKLAAKLAPFGYEPGLLFETIWKGTRAMVKNDGRKCNHEVFWDVLAGVYGETVKEHWPVFDNFYQNEFQQVQKVCGFDARAAKIVRSLKERGFCVVLATNPLFPAAATQSRIRWAGLEPEDFALYTTYDNSCYCKPNPAYYREILEKIGAEPQECVMIGNDVSEDMIAREMGMQVFLLTDCLINKDDADISQYPNGGFDELAAFLDASLKIIK